MFNKGHNMNLSDALKIPGVWWVVLEGHSYVQDAQPTKVEVVKVLETGRHSCVKIDDGDFTRMTHTFDNWDAYDNFWLAWAAIQRSRT